MKFRPEAGTGRPEVGTKRREVGTGRRDKETGIATVLKLVNDQNEVF